MLDLVLNKGLKEEPDPTFKNKGEESFAPKDKIVNYIDRKIHTAIEVDELATYDIQVQTLFHLMKGDVKGFFTAQSFKKVLDPTNPEGYLNDVALRLVSKFYDQKLMGVCPPVPNLGNYTLEQRHTG